MSKAKPVEQREHRIKPKVVDIESYKTREIPELTGRTLKNTKIWWNNFWTSDLSSAIDIKSDLPVIQRLASLMDERERIFKQAKKDRLVVGSQGQVVLNPLYNALLKIDAEIRNLEDRIGLNPKARVSLGIQIGQAKKTLSDLNSELELEEWPFTSPNKEKKEKKKILFELGLGLDMGFTITDRYERKYEYWTNNL